MAADPELHGRKVLIMGAAGALGRAIALRFAAAGADVALTTATPDADEAFGLRRVAKAVSDLGRRSFVESVDMSLGTNVQIAMRQVAKTLGGIDVLVAAPDLRLSRPAERMSDADWAKVLNLNLGGVFYACRSAAREMLGRDASDSEAPRGRIVIVTPAGGSAEAGAAYRAAKAGVEGLARALNDEWSPRGVSVDLVSLPSFEDEAVAVKAAEVIAGLASAGRQSAGGQTMRVDI